MRDLQIAAQLFTLREFIKTPGDIERTLYKVAEMGYKAIQVSAMGPIEPEKLKEIADREGLEICATHMSFDRLKNDLDAVIREHMLWNCRYVGLGFMPTEFGRSRESYITFAKELSAIAKKIKDKGLNFIYHNHSFEFADFDGKTGMDILVEESDPECVGFEIDTYWVRDGGFDPVDWIRKVNGRMGVVHFKDMAIIDNKKVFAEVGEGILDWISIIHACRETGVEYAVVEQDICLRDPFACMETSLKNLEKMGRLYEC